MEIGKYFDFQNLRNDVSNKAVKITDKSLLNSWHGFGRTLQFSEMDSRTHKLLGNLIKIGHVLSQKDSKMIWFASFKYV